MLISNFNRTVDICRQLKTPIVAMGNCFDTIVTDTPEIVEDLSNGYLVGTYEDLCFIRLMPLGAGEIDPRHLDFNEWILINNASRCIKDMATDIVPKELIDGINTPIREFYIDVNRELNRKWCNVKQYIATSVCTFKADFKQLDQFEQFDNSKSADGAMVLRIRPDLCFFIYKGMIPYTKSDSVELYVFTPLIPDNTAMACFKTVRKNKPPIYTFVKYLIDTRNN